MLGSKIQRLRKDNGMSQEELASKLTISRQAISKWELGESMPDTENVVQLSKLFGVTTDFLLYDEYESESDAQAAAMVSDKDSAPEVAEDGAADSGSAFEEPLPRASDWARNVHAEEPAPREEGVTRIFKKPLFWIIAASVVVLTVPLIIILALLTFRFVNTTSESGSHDVIVASPLPQQPTSPGPFSPTPPPSPGRPDASVPPPSPTPVSSIDIIIFNRSVSDLTIHVGEEHTLSVTILPDASNHDIVWHSSDTSIFQIIPTDDTGIEATITALSRGTATLTVTVDGVTAECTVRVRND